MLLVLQHNLEEAYRFPVGRCPTGLNIRGQMSYGSRCPTGADVLRGHMSGGKGPKEADVLGWQMSGGGGGRNVMWQVS